MHDMVTGDSTLASAALRDALQSWNGLLELLPIGVYTCDRAGRLLHYNKRAGELWGRTPAPGDPRERYCGSYRMYRPAGDVLAGLADGETSLALPLGELVLDQVAECGLQLR